MYQTRTHLLERSFFSIEIYDPCGSYEELENKGTRNPLSFRSKEDLVWYDGPIISLGYLKNHENPILEINEIQYKMEGPEDRRVFTGVSHHLEFEAEKYLLATLDEHDIPTMETYKRAMSITRVWTKMTRVNHPEPCYRMITARLAWNEIPEEELPDARSKATGLPTPTNRREKYDYKAR